METFKINYGDIRAVHQTGNHTFASEQENLRGYDKKILGPFFERNMR